MMERRMLTDEEVSVVAGAHDESLRVHVGSSASPADLWCNIDKSKPGIYGHVESDGIKYDGKVYHIFGADGPAYDTLEGAKRALRVLMARDLDPFNNRGYKI